VLGAVLVEVFAMGFATSSRRRMHLTGSTIPEMQL
jgi:hypothetical protein